MQRLREVIMHSVYSNKLIITLPTFAKLIIPSIQLRIDYAD